MAIRTLAAAAALFAFTTAATAQENAAVAVDNISMLSDKTFLGGFAVGITPVMIMGVIAAIVTISEDGTAVVTTTVSTDG